MLILTRREERMDPHPKNKVLISFIGFIQDSL